MDGSDVGTSRVHPSPENVLIPRDVTGQCGNPSVLLEEIHGMLTHNETSVLLVSIAQEGGRDDCYVCATNYRKDTQFTPTLT